MTRDWTTDHDDRLSRHDLAAQLVLAARTALQEQNPEAALAVLASTDEEILLYRAGGELAVAVLVALVALAQEVVALDADAGVGAGELWMEFNRKGLCGLCGNSGVINTFGVRSAAGVLCGVRAYCICPNGRAWKEQGENLSHLEDGTVRR